MNIIIVILAILFLTTSPASRAAGGGPEIPPGITPILTIGAIGLAIVIRNKLKK